MITITNTQSGWLKPAVPNLFWHQGPDSWKTIFLQVEQGGDGLGMIQAYYLCCAPYFYYYYIRSTSNHRAIDPRDWGRIPGLNNRNLSSHNSGGRIPSSTNRQDWLSPRLLSLLGLQTATLLLPLHTVIPLHVHAWYLLVSPISSSYEDASPTG